MVTPDLGLRFTDFLAKVLNDLLLEVKAVVKARKGCEILVEAGQ